MPTKKVPIKKEGSVKKVVKKSVPKKEEIKEEVKEDVVKIQDETKKVERKSVKKVEKKIAVAKIEAKETLPPKMRKKRSDAGKPRIKKETGDVMEKKEEY